MTLPAIAPVVAAACLVQVILSLQVFEVQYALSSGAPPTGSMLAGLAIFNTVIGDISLGYGSAMTMVVGLFIALCLGGLYLVVVRPRPARAVADVDGRFDLPSVNGDPARGPGCGASLGQGPRSQRASPVLRRLARGRLRSPIGAIVPAASAVLLVVWLAGPIAWIALASAPPPAAVARCLHG